LTEARPARPLLATVISLWEASLVVLAIAARFLRIYLRGLHGHLQHPFPPLDTAPLHYAVTAVIYALALASAITLWQMRRSAFYLLATRAVLFFAGFLHTLLRTRLSLISLANLILSSAIAWYVYDITKPKPEIASIPEADSQIEGLSETPNSTQSVARFYLTNDEDQRKSN
jgi:hypothetical protein